jgi:homocysteine S-methyltransferase
VNCTHWRFITPLLEAMRAHTDKPLLVYPNSAEQYDTAAKRWIAAGVCSAWGSLASEWYAAGARLIGGCCRTTPHDIRAIRGWAEGAGGPLHAAH